MVIRNANKNLHFVKINNRIKKLQWDDTGAFSDYKCTVELWNISAFANTTLIYHIRHTISNKIVRQMVV